jgi:hypothetical protein
MKIDKRSLKIKFLFAVLLDEWWKKYACEAGSRVQVKPMAISLGMRSKPSIVVPSTT